MVRGSPLAWRHRHRSAYSLYYHLSFRGAHLAHYLSIFLCHRLWLVHCSSCISSGLTSDILPFLYYICLARYLLPANRPVVPPPRPVAILAAPLLPFRSCALARNWRLAARLASAHVLTQLMIYSTLVTFAFWNYNVGVPKFVQRSPKNIYNKCLPTDCNQQIRIELSHILHELYNPRINAER